MKKVSKFFLVFTIGFGLFFSSCHPDPKSESIQNAAAADAVAAWNMFGMLSGAGACGGPVGEGGVGVISLAWGVAASAYGFRTSHPNATFISNGVLLPSIYYNSNSKFECIGKFQ